MDLSLADRHNDAYVPPDGAEIGAIHALEWPRLRPNLNFQPFKQLGREAFALAEAEQQADRIIQLGLIANTSSSGWASRRSIRCW